MLRVPAGAPRREAAGAASGGSAPATTSISAPSSSASHAARAAGSSASGTGRCSAAVTMCDGAQTVSRPVFSAQSISVRDAATPKRGSPSQKRAGGLLDREARCTAAPRSRAAGTGDAGATQSTSGWPHRPAHPAIAAHRRPRPGPGRDRPPAAVHSRSAPAPCPPGATRGLLGHAAAHDLHAERARNAVELLQPDKDADERGSARQARHTLGQGLQQVRALRAQLVVDGLGEVSSAISLSTSSSCAAAWCETSSTTLKGALGRAPL